MYVKNPLCSEEVQGTIHNRAEALYGQVRPTAANSDCAESKDSKQFKKHGVAERKKTK
jgi:hypothetical protein